MTEFNAFKDSVDVTDNTQSLVRQLTDNTKLVLTTIQKLNNAVSGTFAGKIELRHKKIVFIFDECHRSQFGETHERITKFFEKSQLIGFTGTPIFAENASK
jgi:type I restriction enzyme R subunit